MSGFSAAPQLVRLAFPLLLMGSGLVMAATLPEALLLQSVQATAICGFLCLLVANLALTYYVFMEELKAHAKLLTMTACVGAGLGAIFMISATAVYIDYIGKNWNTGSSTVVPNSSTLKPEFQTAVAICGSLLTAAASVMLLLDHLGVGGGPGSGRMQFSNEMETGATPAAASVPPATVESKAQY